MRRQRDEGNEMQIRPHHLLCMARFVGKGYSEEFVLNMKSVISALNSGEKFELTNGSDDICKACPFNLSGVCKDEEKVVRYDSAAKAALALDYKEKYSYKDLCITDADIKEICSDCEWAELCAKIKV